MQDNNSNIDTASELRDLIFVQPIETDEAIEDGAEWANDSE